MVAGEDIKEHISLLWEGMHADMGFGNHHKSGYAGDARKLVLPFHHVRKSHFVHRKLRWKIIKQVIDEMIVNKFLGIAVFNIKCQVDAKIMVHRFIVYNLILIYKHS